MSEVCVYTSNRQRFIEVHTLEWLCHHKPKLLTLPKQPGYIEIVWIKKARGTVRIDLESRSITENEVYCIGATQMRCFYAEDNMEGYYMSFAPTLVNLSLAGSRSLFVTEHNPAHDKARIILESTDAKDEIERVVQAIMKEISRPFKIDLEILHGLVLLVMNYLARSVRYLSAAKVSRRKQELIDRFLSSVERNFTTRKMVHDYASELAVSSGYLNFLVKRSTGFTATYHIQQRKLLEAKKQILWHGKSLKEVAYSLGFCDPPHFSNFFKAKTGMNFLDFRSGIGQEHSPGSH
jgi:AraC family transcriptional regulator, transcriptional activator of pobA